MNCHFYQFYLKGLISQILGKVRQYIVKHDLLFHKSKATKLSLPKSKVLKERNEKRKRTETNDSPVKPLYNYML